MAITLDPTTQAAYLVGTTLAARASAVVSAFSGTVTVKIFDGTDAERASGTFGGTWATSSGGTITVGEVISLTVSNGGTPDESWYVKFEDADSWLRGSFGLAGSGKDFRWSGSSFVTGQTAELGTVTFTATDPQIASAPINLTAPVISGTVQVGYTLTATSGTWSGTPAPTYSYQWRRGSTNISGATSASYTLTASDEGEFINVVVTATNIAGSASQSSAQAGPVDPASVLPSGDVALYTMWDGPTGVDYRHFDKFSGMAWVNAGGDWLNSAGARQVNSSPWATLSVATTINTLCTATVTSLVSQWLSTGHQKGFFFKNQTGTVGWFHGRQAATAGYRPILRVVTSAGTFDCSCTSSVNISVGEAGWQSGRTEIASDNTLGNCALQFDLSAVTGTLTSAQLRVYTSRASAGTTINIYEVDAKGYILADGGTPLNEGIATGVGFDAGIENHPGVLAVGDFSIPLGAPASVGTYAGVESETAATVWNGSTARSTLNEQAYDPALRAHRLRVAYHGDASGQGTTPMDLSLEVWSPPDAQKRMTTANAPDEIFSRYHIEYDADWEPYQGVKTPGVHGRFGNHTTYGTRLLGGYWDGNWTGHGGTIPTGTEEITPDGTHVGEYRYGGWSFLLWTPGTNLGPSSNDDPTVQALVDLDPNPYRAMVPLRTYYYHMGLGAPGGEGFGSQYQLGEVLPTVDMFGNTYGPTLMLQKGVRYSVEIQIVMNSVTGADADGNGTPVADGIARVWINDVLRFQRTDIRWRANEKIGVQGSWLNSFHGGGTYPLPPNIHYKIDSHLVATEKIGPRQDAALPAWVPEAGKLRTLTLTNTFDSQDPYYVDPVLYPRTSWDSGGLGDHPAMLHAYGGGCLNPYWGDRGAMVFHGGGHYGTSSYAGNQIVILDLDDLTFKRQFLPTDKNNNRTLSATWREHADGQPSVPHVYDGIDILPPEWGGGSKGSAVTFARYAAGPVGNESTPTAHKYDFASPATKWARFSDANSPNTAWQASAPSGAFDSLRGCFWWFTALDWNPPRIHKLDATTGVVTNYSFSNAAPGSGDGPTGGTTIYDPVRDILVNFTPTTSGASLAWFDPANPTDGWHSSAYPSVTRGLYLTKVAGDSPDPNLTSCTAGISECPGITYVPELDQYLLWSAGTPGGVFYVTPTADPKANPLTPWTVQYRAFQANSVDGATSIVSPTGGGKIQYGKRWTYCSKVKAVVFTATDNTGTTYAYRPIGV